MSFNYWIIMKWMKLIHLSILHYLHLTLLTCRADYRAFTGNKQYGWSTSASTLSIGVAHPKALNIMVIRLLLVVLFDIDSNTNIMHSGIFVYHIHLTIGL